MGQIVQFLFEQDGNLNVITAFVTGFSTDLFDTNVGLVCGWTVARRTSLNSCDPKFFSHIPLSMWEKDFRESLDGLGAETLDLDTVFFLNPVLLPADLDWKVLGSISTEGFKKVLIDQAKTFMGWKPNPEFDPSVSLLIGDIQDSQRRAWNVFRGLPG